MSIIRVEKLSTYFNTDEGTVKAVDGVSFELKEKEILAIVGESGCGKSVCAQTIMGLLKCPPAIINGSIIFQGKELTSLNEKEYTRVRGKQIGMIFQEPMSAFDPLYTVGEQISEAYLTHYGDRGSKEEAKAKIINMLKKVGISESERRFEEYPHQMSGGMLQRIMIALTLVCEPSVLIADEPTTALDVTIQAQVLKLMRDLQKETGTSIIFITHDLGVVAEIADRVHVMYAGKIVEKGDTEELFSNPLHPYTKGLLDSRLKKENKGKTLPYITGNVPRAFEFPEGCRFNPRCRHSMDICREKDPFLRKIESTQSTACYLYEGDEEK